MKTALVTGANGFIGSHIVCGLLARGYSVHALGRSTADDAWPDRMAAALRAVDDTGTLPDALHCHEFDLTSPDPRLSFLSPRNCPPGTTMLIHAAGDTKFTPADPQRQREINVQAPVNLVKAFKGRIARMVHLSTAFVAGCRTGLVREDELNCGQDFHNCYEKSKCDAEVALVAVCREHSVPLVIVRPSIIINDRGSGHASTITHLNALVEVINRIQEHHRITDGQVVSRQIRVAADPESRPNLAPVDSIIPPVLQIATSPGTPGNAFHLCHPHPPSIRELVGLICDALDIRGKIAFDFTQTIPSSPSYTEEMILRALKPYGPYLNARCEFDLTRSRSFVANYDSHFTPLDVPYLRKVIQSERGHRR